MKKITYTTAIFTLMTASSAMAHHPAADIVDAATYEMIDANVADTPHADLVFDDMGGSMDAASSDQNGVATDIAEVGAAADLAMESAGTVETIDLMENVVDSLAQ